MEDHAFLAEALIDLYEATGDAQWLEHCTQLLDDSLPAFYDPAGGGFYRSANAALLIRQKSFEDGAEPSGMSRLVQTLLRLRALGHRLGQHPGVASSIAAGSHTLRLRPASVPELLAAYERSSRSAVQVVVASADPPSAEAMLSVYRERFRPDAVLAHLSPQSPAPEGFSLLEHREIPTEGARAYVCMDYTCKVPAFDPRTLWAELDDVEDRA